MLFFSINCWCRTFFPIVLLSYLWSTKLTEVITMFHWWIRYASGYIDICYTCGLILHVISSKMAAVGVKQFVVCSGRKCWHRWDMAPGGHCLNYYPGTHSHLISDCNLLEDRAPVDEIYGCPIVQSVAVTTKIKNNRHLFFCPSPTCPILIEKFQHWALGVFLQEHYCSLMRPVREHWVLFAPVMPAFNIDISSCRLFCRRLAFKA